MTPPTLTPARRLVKFGDVIALNRDRVADPAADGLERYVGLEHITPEDLHIRSWGLVAEGTTFTNYFQPGQVLFGKRRAYQRKVAVADFVGVCSGDIYVLEPIDPVVLLPELLPFICQTEGFYEHAVGTSAGSLSPRTNWKQLSKYEFPLPPLDEQSRIIKVLDAVRKVLDEANQAFISAKALSRVALNNIVIGFAADSLDEYRLVTDIPLPENWQFLKAQDLCTVKVTSGSTPRTGIVDDDTGMPFLRVQNLEFDCSLDFNSNPKFLNDGVFKGTEAQHVIPGDVLTNIVGPPLGKVSIVPNEFPESQINQAIVRFRPKDNYLRSIISGYLMSDWAKRWLFSRSKKTSGQRNINSSTCAILPIPTPPKSEQEKIAKLIENVKLTGDKTEKRLEQSQTMMKQMLSKFLGGN